MSQPFIAEIRSFAFDFAPRGWALCNGQLLPIAQNTALFSLLGTTYGGDGRTTFALPDLRGRVPIHPGANRRPANLGELGGMETHALSVAELAAHGHAVQVDSSPGSAQSPTGGVPAGAAANMYGNANDAALDAAMVSPTGAGQAHDNREPYLVLNYCIALVGVFPSRS